MVLVTQAAVASRQTALRRLPLAPPAAIGSPVFLDSAVLLTLDLVPRQPEALALVATLTQRVRAAERQAQQRKTQRLAAGLAKLQQAIGAIVGGLLRAWWHPKGPRPVARSHQAESFTPKTRVKDSAPEKDQGAQGAAAAPGPAAVGRRLFKTVIDGLKAEGLIVHKTAVRLPPTHHFRMGQGGQGRSARYWPTAALLRLAEAHGLKPALSITAFRATAPQQLPPRALLELRPFPGQRGDVGLEAAPPAIWRDLEDDVAAQNALAALTSVDPPPDAPCYPPQWYRVFRGSWRLQGRWYASGTGRDVNAGHASSYASLPATQRAQMRIGGETVVELDVSGSHCTLLLGLLGSALPDADPYKGYGYPRWMVKRWVMQLCGLGRPPLRWSRGGDRTAEIPSDPIKLVGAAVMRRQPMLARPDRVVPESLVQEVGQPAQALVTHYLAAREAEAMTLAMRVLRQQGILALPVYDSLIVPASAEAVARCAIMESYVAVCGLSPRVTCKVVAHKLRATSRVAS